MEGFYILSKAHHKAGTLYHRPDAGLAFPSGGADLKAHPEAGYGKPDPDLVPADRGGALYGQARKALPAVPHETGGCRNLQKIDKADQKVTQPAKGRKKE